MSRAALPTQAPGAARPSPSGVGALRAIALAGVYGGLLLPLVVGTDLVVFPFIFAKLLFYQALIGLTLPACLTLWVLDPQSRPRRSAVLGALAFYCAALALSTVRSIDPHRSFWSNQERMSGLFQLLHYFAWFLMASSLLRTWEAWRRLLLWQAGIGLVMASIAILQRPFPNLVGGLSDIRVSGTLGNPIFSAAWHMVQVFLLGFLWLRTGPGPLRKVLPIAGLASLAALWLSGSRGPVLGLLVGLAVAALAYSARTRRWAVLAWVCGLLALAGGLYAAVVKWLVPLASLEKFWREHPALTHLFLADFDPSRRKLWAKAWEAFRDRPLSGYGLSTFDLVFDIHHEPWFRCQGLPGTLEDSSHSLLFDHLATTGALGTLGFLLLWGCVFAALLRGLRRGDLGPAEGAVLLAAPAAYLAQGLFVFDSPGVFVMTHLLLALAAGAATGALAPAPAGLGRDAMGAPRLAGRWLLVLFPLQLWAAALVFQTTVQPARASYDNRRAQEPWRRGDCAAALAASREVFKLPTPWLDDQLFSVARSLGTLASQGKLQSCPQWRELLGHARAVTGAILRDHPVHARQRSIFATVLHLLGREAKDPALVAEAGPLLLQLVGESPVRQQYRFDYANWLADQGRVQEARAQLEAALAAEESIGESRWRLGTFLWRNLQESRAGAEQMSRAQAGGCAYQFRNAVELQQLAQAYSVLGDRAGLKSMISRVQQLSFDAPPTAATLAIAGYLERNGLVTERDAVLDLAIKRDVTVAARLAPLRSGQVQSLAELERLAAPAPQPDAAGPGGGE